MEEKESKPYEPHREQEQEEIEQQAEETNVQALEEPDEEQTKFIEEITSSPVFNYSPELLKFRFGNLSEEEWRKLGFYTAIQHPAEPMVKLNALITEYREIVAEKLKNAEDLSGEKETSFKEHIAELENEISETYKFLEEHKLEIEELKEIEEELILNLASQQGKLLESIATFSKKKRDLVKDRIIELHNELKEHTSQFSDLFKGKNSVNQESYNANKGVLESKVKSFKELREGTEAALKDLNQDIKKESIGGINPTIYGHLLYVGFGLAWVAGWFFATYVQEKQFGNDDYVSLFIKSITFFGGRIFPNNLLYSGLINLGLVFFILLSVTLVSLQIKKSADKEKRRRYPSSSENFKSEYSFSLGDKSNLYQTQLKSTSFYEFWLNALPFFLFVGLLFVIASVAIPKEEFSKATFAMAGQIVGTFIALGTSGIIMLYWSKVIEPRRQKGDENQLFRFKYNWEIYVSLIIFLISFILLILDLFEGKDKKIIATLFFFSVSILTGFVVAYGLRLKGLMKTRKMLQQEIKNLTVAIEDNSRPIPLSIQNLEVKKFQKNYQELSDQLYEMIETRNDWVLTNQGSRKQRRRQNQPEREVNQGIFHAIKANFSKLFSNRETLIEPDVEDREDFKSLLFSDADFELFPDQIYDLMFLREEFLNTKMKLEKVEEDILKIKRQESPFAKEKEWKIDSLKNERRHLKKMILDQKQILIELRDAYDIQTHKNLTQLHDGFDLGCWYLSHEVGESEFKKLS